ncbi:hypothetical protein [Cytobacillus purgationiresistens]|uniref:Uncharacterized protein n=1 Tax=Cytobacillus purgationiresistens TaxID=863449 RepID=A0ABU0AK23_9BACI|nr:hypothetical protein [Cytobacillus purgationiresistens]MDQ0271613.1 hypothetical protein [Cytobacillus purgationiresistens]
MNFDKSETWFGGYYELSIEFYPTGDNERINQALTALCSNSHLNGLWMEKTFHQKDMIVPPILIEDNSVQQFYVILTTAGGIKVPGMISIIRISGESDWLDLSIPLRVLELIYPVKYPLLVELNPWLKEIHDL